METTNRPLYKVLNEKRTQGNILATIDGNLAIENSEKIIGFIITDSADSQYTALAVNNLADIAQCLEDLHRVVMLSNDRAIFDNGENANIVAKAKKALNKIS